MLESVLISFHFPPCHPLRKFPSSFSKNPTLLNFRCSLPITYYPDFPRLTPKIGSFREARFRAVVFSKRGVSVKVNGFNGLGGGGGGGGGKMNSETARVLGNLALAIFLAYLSMTGQLGWLLDAIVSLWFMGTNVITLLCSAESFKFQLLAVLVPIVGIGAFLWWAGRDIVQSSCPNCGNEFQVFKSTLNDDLQLCPFCSQPFSVEGNEFVRDPVKFSNQSTTFGQAFNDSFGQTKKRKESSISVVDVEAEVRDAD